MSNDPLIQHIGNPLAERYRLVFLAGGMLFLTAGLLLLLVTGYLLYLVADNISSSSFEMESYGSGNLTETQKYNYYGRIMTFFLPPFGTLISSIIATSVGIRLLRSSGAVATQVIAPQDYPILGPAVSAGNEQAITQWIRLNSLSGVTGTFTKIGLTGLPLATIVLTLLLGAAGLVNAQFFDLAKLTLGAFLGSFVQRQVEVQRSDRELAARH